MEVLAAFHRDQPKAAGMEFPTLRRHCAPALDIETFIALLRLFAAGKVIDLAGSHACLPRHSASANPADEALWRRLKPLLDTAGFKSVRVAELAEAAKVKQAVVQDFLHRKAQTGDVCRVVPDRFYLRTTLAQLASLAESLAGNQPGQQFTTAQFRDASGVSRGHATEILECLDRLGITLRIGDVRKIRKDFTPILGPAPLQSSPPR
jgi:selenocysteine-specific elongation factor